MIGGRGSAEATLVCVLVVVSVATVGAVGAPGSASGDDDGNEPPLADAGLDQRVPVNGTVYLDATGSRDPDGRIASYRWTVDRPDGTTMTPGCGTCARPEFVVRSPGTYDVTVTVTDDDGTERSDTLRVAVSAVEGPSVELSGPTGVAANATVEYTASMAAGHEPLASVDWAVDGGEESGRDLDGQSATDDLVGTFSPGTHRVTVTVVDELGRTETSSLTVEAVADDESGNGSTGDGSGDGSSDDGSSDDEGDDGSSGDESDDGSSDDGSSGNDDVAGDGGSVTNTSTPCDEGPTSDTIDPDCAVDSLIGINEDYVIVDDTNIDGTVTINGEEYSPSTVGGYVHVPRDEWDEFYETQIGEDPEAGEIYFNENAAGDQYVSDSTLPSSQEVGSSQVSDYYGSENDLDIEGSSGNNQNISLGETGGNSSREGPDLDEGGGRGSSSNSGLSDWSVI